MKTLIALVTLLTVQTHASKFDKNTCIAEELSGLSKTVVTDQAERMYVVEQVCNEKEVDACLVNQMEQLSQVKGLSLAGKMYEALAYCHN